ncbi:MAG: hypothetical protein EBR01_00870 [Proteobacteria bacterium]|nr:hypothetical protein [Pseudomonadota bacterium]NBY19071.1 hypothetical protein [bacterium]
MKNLICLISLLVFSQSFKIAVATNDKPQQIIRMGISSSRTVKIPRLSRVAVGNSKIVKASSVSNKELLLIGKSKGSTTVRAWDEKGGEFRYEVRVIASEAENLLNEDERGVVKISLEFLELDQAVSQVSGIRWPESIQFTGVANILSQAAVTGLNYEFAFSTAQGWLNHLVREGWAKIVANPELYVRLGEEAVFHSGGEFPVATSSENFGRSYRHIEWKGYGLTAKVLPQSVDKIHISSDVNLEISELISTQNMEGVPALNKRSIRTKMNSLDGETVILSGLIKQNSKKEKEGLPLLSSIPILGPLLFSKSIDESERTELLMAVTFSMSTKAREKEFRQLLKSHSESLK